MVKKVEPIKQEEVVVTVNVTVKDVVAYFDDVLTHAEEYREGFKKHLEAMNIELTKALEGQKKLEADIVKIKAMRDAAAKFVGA